MVLRMGMVIHTYSIFLPLLSPLAANFPCLTHLSHLLFRGVVNGSVMEVLHTTTLSIVQTRRKEGQSKVSKLDDYKNKAY